MASAVLWAAPTPAPLAPVSQVLCLSSASLPGHHLEWRSRGLTAGAETGLSCSHDGCPTIPRPLRRRVLQGCISKLFTPSMAFASTGQARLPVDPLRALLLDAAGFASCCGLVACTLPWSPNEGLTPRFNARLS